jgi:glyoxylase-like metal-dependent hydrolase (beta-lactamase superfamily II)
MGKKDVKTEERDLVVKRFVSLPNETNTYLLIEGNEAAVIDVAHAYPEVRDALKEIGVTLKYLLVTHGDPADLGSLRKTKENLGGMLCLHRFDTDLLKEADSDLEPDILVKDNDSLKFGSTAIKVLHTPGHTMGSLCFHIREAKALFTGDTLLKGQFGRIKGPHSMGLMLRSLKRLNSVIPPKTTIYPGHGPMTTMSKEAWLDTLDNLS